MSQRASNTDSATEGVPRTYLKQNGEHIRLDLTREQFEDLQERNVHMEPHNGGILVDCSRTVRPEPPRDD